MNSIFMEAEIMRSCPLPGLKNVYVREDSCSFTCVAQVEKKFDGQGNWYGNAILGTAAARLVKYLILVDTDIDQFSSSQVGWAVATRSQPSRDVLIIQGVTGVTLDPSIPEEGGTGLTSIMVIDATKPIERFFPNTPMPPKDIQE